MDRPSNDDSERAERQGPTPIDSDSDDARAQAREDDSDDAIGTASYEMQRGEGGSGGGADDDEHAATPVGGGSLDDTHAASAVGGGTIYAPAPDDATEEPLDASGMQSGSGNLPPAPPIDGGAGGRPPSGQASEASGTPPPPPSADEGSDASGDRGYDDPVSQAMERQMERERQSGASGGSDDGDGTYTVREGAVRADDDISTVRTDVDMTGAATRGVTRAIDPDEIELRRDRAVVEDDNAARVQADIAGFDPDRELARPPDFPESLDVATVAPDGTTVPGRTSQLTDPLTGEAIGGGRSVSDSVKAGLGGLGVAPDRGLDFDPTSPGTQDQDSRETTGDPSVDRAISEHDGSLISAEPPGGTPPKTPPAKDWTDRAWDWVTGGGGTDGGTGTTTGGPRTRNPDAKIEPKPTYMENPDADSGDSETNLERVTVMQGSQVQPSNNPDDPATGGESTEGWIPPADLETMPAQDGETADTTLTSAATLGSSPVTNPTDPVLGEDGIIAGGTYGGSGGSGGGGEIMPTGVSAGDASALGGEGEANLPITVEPAPVGGGASALGGEGEANLPITVEPAPVVGAGELAQKDDINGASIDMATGQAVGSAALGDDAASAIGAADATLGGESLGAPGGLEGPPPIGEDGAPPDGDDS